MYIFTNPFNYYNKLFKVHVSKYSLNELTAKLSPEKNIT